MSGKRRLAAKAAASRRAGVADYRWQYGKLVPAAVIRDFARQIAQQFHPDRIILFGSYAYGKPHKDSDVDILVVMPAYDEINQAVRILRKTDPGFPTDLIVRTPHNLRWRLEEGDWFLRDLVAKGKVLYEKTDRSLDSQGAKRFSGRQEPGKAASASP
jgi:predicted nucleotidyltransferase